DRPAGTSTSRLDSSMPRVRTEGADIRAEVFWNCQQTGFSLQLLQLSFAFRQFFQRGGAGNSAQRPGRQRTADIRNFQTALRLIPSKLRENKACVETVASTRRIQRLHRERIRQKLLLPPQQSRTAASQLQTDTAQTLVTQSQKDVVRLLRRRYPATLALVGKEHIALAENAQTFRSC